jgi:hypothetical protein
VASIEISNNLPYAGPIEKGSKLGERPWPSAGPLTLVMGGRVFSKQAPGGMIGPILKDTAKDVAKEIWKEIDGTA